MLKRLLIDIRRKPKVVRNQIALGVAGGFTFLVVMVWLYHAPERFEFTEADNSDGSGSFADLFSGINEQLSAVNESSVSESSTTESVDSAAVTTEKPTLELTWSTSTIGREAAASAEEWSGVDDGAVDSAPDNGRPVRIMTVSKATTSDAVSSTSANGF